MKKALSLTILLVSLLSNGIHAQAIIADHLSTDIYAIPVAAIEKAKADLHIAYGFTSHGSQIISGMLGLDSFMSPKGYKSGLFAFDGRGTTAGSLHLFQGDGYGSGDLDHDAGYYPNWVDETRNYLGTPTPAGRGNNHPQMNVIMWAWCGQLSWYSDADVQNSYLKEMNKLETDYPGITFVYMTGHSDGSGLEGTLHRNNQTIRQYCIANGKVLFDFYDIECYDPDGRYFGDKHVTDECNYDGGNWAREWQNTHTKNVDWYVCDPAHTEHVNGNRKAYAVWWLWARLAGWDGKVGDSTGTEEGKESHQGITLSLGQNYPNPFNNTTTIPFFLDKERHVKLCLYDMKGRLVRLLLDASLPAGNRSVKLESGTVPSGIYFYQLNADGFVQVKQLLYLR